MFLEYFSIENVVDHMILVDQLGFTIVWLGSLVFNFVINKAVVHLVWSLSLW